MIAPKPKNEQKRLAVLWQYDVLDTPPEAMFDDFVELASCICEAPISVISLIDENRQWFKSKTGITQKETSRDISFCAHAILHEGLFIVPDATKDKRFADNPLVTGKEGIRFYAGVPLVTPDGHALGTLCVLDKVPRKLTEEQKRALCILSRHVMTQLELRQRTRELAKAKAEEEKLRECLAEFQTQLRQVKQSLSNGKAHPAIKVAHKSPRKKARGKK